jgi:hypothetical protein
MADLLVFISTTRVGQLTGTTSNKWPSGRPNSWRDLVDAERWPLLMDTGSWGMWGVDLGANCEHSDGRLYFFFGDVAEVQDFGDVAEVQDLGVPRNADLVAWTDAPKVLSHGGHQAQGWDFVIPNDHQGASETTAQKDWRLCAKCHSLFWAPNEDPAGSVCPADRGLHAPLGWNFFLPSREQGATEATGQKDWRFCAK